MSETQHISQVTHEMEARAMFEQRYGEGDDNVDDAMEYYKTLAKHIGWEDKRKDDRFIVKFHDIVYYASEIDNFDVIFENFCMLTYNDVICELDEMDVDTDHNLTFLATRGNYRSFKVKMPCINDDNIVDLAEAFLYEQGPIVSHNWAEEHIAIVDALQCLEDTYFKQWLDYLDANEYATPAQIDKFKHEYNKDHKDNPIK